MSFQVSATDLGRIRLNEPETVNAVLQNIALVLATPKGSVPMYRDFGLPQDFLDMLFPRPSKGRRCRLFTARKKFGESSWR